MNSISDASASHRKIRPWLIFVCTFLAAVLLFGGVFATLSVIRNKQAVFRCGTLSLNSGEYAYFATYRKHLYLRSLNASGVGCYDGETFWNTKDADGRTYGEKLRADTHAYVREILAAASLYDACAAFTAEQKRLVDDSVRQLLDYRSGGDEDAFDLAVKDMGFSYKDVKSAAVIQYKAQNACTAAFGVDGASLQTKLDICDDYLAKNYAHVKLLFIRTETGFAVDSEGNRLKDESGNDILNPLTDAEKADRQNRIAEIRGAIENLKSESGVQMTPLMFDGFLERYGEGDPDFNDSGYYFAENAAFTKEFAAATADTASADTPVNLFGEMIRTALDMEKGSYAEVGVDFGVCFLYRDEVESAAFADPAVSDCFSDFFPNLADALFAKRLAEHSLSVTDGQTTPPDVISLPYNAVYFVRF